MLRSYYLRVFFEKVSRISTEVIMAVEIPQFEHTSIQSIPSIVNEVRTTFHEHRTRSVEYRLGQLRKLYWG